MRDPDTDSVQAFRELLGDSQMSPWYVNVMAPDLESARVLARELEALPTVGRTIHLSSYVPENQLEKLEKPSRQVPPLLRTTSRLRSRRCGICLPC